MTYQLLLDTSSLMYRAFFALPDTIRGADGQPVNAVHGYLDTTARLQSTYQPERIVHVFDHDWRPASRVAAYEGYKANRVDDPPTLPPQFTWLREVLAALGAATAEVPDWEADDAIGTLCAQAGKRDRIDIVSGDRDLMQLVRDDGPAVRLLFPRARSSDLEVYDRAAVEKAYGVPPERYVDFATLRGDPSDGLPGVRGIGEKTAQRLVSQYPDLDALLADAAAQTPRIAASLRESESYLKAMRAVVPIRTDLDVRWTTPDADEARLAELAEERKLGGPIGRLRAALES